jgi:hypothetical protein
MPLHRGRETCSRQLHLHQFPHLVRHPSHHYQRKSGDAHCHQHHPRFRCQFPLNRRNSSDTRCHQPHPHTPLYRCPQGVYPPEAMLPPLPGSAPAAPTAASPCASCQTAASAQPAAPHTKQECEAMFMGHTHTCLATEPIRIIPSVHRTHISEGRSSMIRHQHAQAVAQAESYCINT